MSKRSRARSEQYHDEIKQRLDQVGLHAPKPHDGLAVFEVAEIENQAQMHTLRRHVNKRGRVVR